MKQCLRTWSVLGFVGVAFLGAVAGCQSEEVEVEPSLELERKPREHKAIPVADPELLPPPGLMSEKATSLTEPEKMERMLPTLETSDAVFIRNGSESSGKEAAQHLRRKLKNAGGKITTAQDFVEQLASKSSMSGKPYKVRLADGTEVDSGAWFTSLLESIESSPRP